MFRLLALISILATPLFSQHNVYLKSPNTIPLYAQQTNVWCGAGSAQMMLEGYPGGKNHTYQQKYIWETLQHHKQENWYCDPDGLKGVMRQLGGGNRWQTCYYYHQGPPLMHYLAKWMTNRRFPFAVLVYGHQHWVVIVGISTDVDPNTSNNIYLRNIEVHDPWKGRRFYITGTSWYQRFWYKAGNNPGSKWNNCYVGVNEIGNRGDNKHSGVAIAPKAINRGSIIVAKTATKLAQQAAKKLEQKENYALLKQLQPLTPMLVNEKYQGYYLIPMGDPKTQLSSAAIILNAYSGDFEMAAIFNKPIKYLEKKQVASISKSQNTKLIFTPSQQCRSPFDPVWQVKTAKRKQAIYYDQEGKTFTKLTAMAPGS